MSRDGCSDILCMPQNVAKAILTSLDSVYEQIFGKAEFTKLCQGKSSIHLCLSPQNTREYLQSFNAKIGQVHSFMLDQVVLEGETYNSAYDQLIYADFNMSSITFTAGSSDPQGPTLIEVFYTSILDWLVVMQEGMIY